MDKDLPFFNCSFKKVFSKVPDSFSAARIKIILTILILSYVKLAVVIVDSLVKHQNFQLTRAIIVLVIYTALLKWLLYRPSHIRTIAHLLIITGLLIIWANPVLNHKNVNIVLLQMIFMVSLCSFYLLDKKFGVIYSALAALPIFLIVAFKAKIYGYSGGFREEIGSPGIEILIFFNFVTLIYAHYLFYQAIQQNMDEKADLNSKLKEAVEEANKLALSKSDFLSVMSHELRTPLNTVLGSTSMLLNNDPKESQKEDLRALKFSTNNLLNLINDILEFNRTESDKMELEVIPVNLSETMYDIFSGIKFAANEKKLELILNIDPELSQEVVLSDPTRLIQVIYNLLWNAIKFTDKGSVTLSLSQLENTEKEVKVRFLVSDTGIGINEDRQEAIFEPFTQAYSNTTRHFGGTGLGLAIVKRLLLLFNSNIHLKSCPDKGSDFFFDIVFDRTELALSPVNPQLEFDLQGMKILIAEDNEMNTLLMKKLLSKWNTECEYVGNGSVILDLFSKGFYYDVILMDLNMPVMDGIEATKAIRKMENHMDIQIIALTASVSDEIRVKIHEAGMNDYVYKPFEPAVLYQKLQLIQNNNVKQGGTVNTAIS
ncbi:ATP-binding protein [Pedobacter frigoris]|uniref:histidine kinase n=1 Tax=Pedobacter frigoris TaxID=2571272 RepID=A0A4U1CKP3_9SPHI|nr:ATP-binding protein [Pedobacter frigoris]TKC05999.1 response regulator [Pedobacter frigoris]